MCYYIQWTHAQGGSLGEVVLYEPLRVLGRLGEFTLIEESTGIAMDSAAIDAFIKERLNRLWGPDVTELDFTEAAAGRPPWPA